MARKRRKTLVEGFPEIARLSPMKRGEESPDLDYVNGYLRRFGYLSPEETASAKVSGETMTALKKYQKAHGLRATGVFDAATRDQMATARCGLPDVGMSIAASTTCAWDRRGLTFAFDTGTADVAGNAEFDAVRAALLSWTDVAAPFTFTEVGVNDNPDIRIGWRVANDPDHSMVGGVLAHADFPPGCGVVTNTLPKPVHFDDEEHAWVVGSTANAYDIETVALHELGHILGLAHSSVAGSVMWPSVTANATHRALTADDITGFMSLYPSPPAVASWSGNRLDVFGLGTNRAMFHKAWNGSAWRPSATGWEDLGGVFWSPPAVVAWGGNRLDVFGLGTDRAMYHKAWDGSAWRPSQSGWESLGGVFTSPPEVVAWGPGRLDVFGLGTDRAMYHKAWDGSAWRPSKTGWENLGGVFASPPAVASWEGNRLDVFGLGTNRAVFHKAWDGSAWRPSKTGWENLGGTFTSPPAVVAWDWNRLDVFGLGTNRAMFHKAWDGGAWRPSLTGWEGLGGVFNSPPAVVAWDFNRLDVFGLGTDLGMYHKAWDGSGWRPSMTGWEGLGGTFTSPPEVVAWSANRLDVFALGSSREMRHKAWNGSAWKPSQTGWENLGGVFA